MATAPHTTDRYRLSYPAITPGAVITQGHADYCAVNGHATHTHDGVTQPHCPRCGERTTPAPPTGEPTVLASAWPRVEYPAGTVFALFSPEGRYVYGTGSTTLANVQTRASNYDSRATGLVVGIYRPMGVSTDLHGHPLPDPMA